MTIGPPDAADMLPAASRLLASMKYRINDVHGSAVARS